jgi:copper chaperone CopZ
MSEAQLKPKGPWEVRRKIKVPTLLHTSDARIVERALGQVGGVRAFAVDIPRHLITVRYEMTETDHESVRIVLDAAGFPPADGWWARRKYHWLQSIDITSRENAGVKSSPCCNKPPTASR